jgi:hypothetical protein
MNKLKNKIASYGRPDQVDLGFIESQKNQHKNNLKQLSKIYTSHDKKIREHQENLERERIEFD